MRVDEGWVGEYDFEQEHGRMLYGWISGWRICNAKIASIPEFERAYASLEDGLLSFELIALCAPDNVYNNFECNDVRLALEGMLLRIATTLARVIPEYREKYLRSPWGQSVKNPEYLETLFVATCCEDREHVKAVLGL